MKKTFKFKRWMAFALAFLLIATTCISSADAFLSADEGAEVTADAPTIETHEISPEPAEAVPTPASEPEQAPEPVPESEPTPEPDPGPDLIPEEPTDLVLEETPEEEITTISPVQDPSVVPDTSDIDATSDNGNKYKYSIYFYYDETEGNRIEGEGTLGESILQSANVTVKEGTVEYDGQNYIWVETVNKDGVITEDEISNTVKVLYELSDESDDPEVSEGDDQDKDTDKEETAYSLNFINDPVDGGEVKVVSVDGEAAGAETAYAEGTKVTFEVSANKGYDIETVKVQGKSSLTVDSVKDDTGVYTVTVQEDTVVAVAYEEDETAGPKRSSQIKALDGTTVKYTIGFRCVDEEPYDETIKKSLTFEGSVGEAIYGSTLCDKYEQAIPGYVCKSWDFAEGDAQDQLLYLQENESKNFIWLNYYAEGASIIFMDENETIKTIEGTTGKVITDGMPETPKKDGSKFLGWYDAQGSKIEKLPEKFPAGKTVYTAKWETEEQKKSVKIWKKTDKDTYRVGEKITYTITVENTGTCELENVQLKDRMTTGSGTIVDSEKSFDWFTVPETKTWTYTYDVQQSDAGKKIVNTVELCHSDIELEVGSQMSCSVNVEAGEPSLTLSKEATSTPKNGSAYSAGEEITYEITAKNTGNLTLEIVNITDELTKDSWEIKELKPGDELSFKTNPYKVTTTDVQTGSVINTAKATAKAVDGQQTEAEATKEVATVKKNPSLFVEKKVTDEPGKVYQLGDLVNYSIDVLNNGNVSLYVQINDPETGEKWEIKSLEPNKGETFVTSYRIQEKDIREGAFVNTVTASGKDSDGNEVTYTAQAKVDTERAKGHLTVSKKVISEPKDGKAYGLNEKVTYLIGVVNDGNLTLEDVSIKDDLTGEKWEIGTLEPGKSSDLKVATYEVQEKDIIAGHVTNVATAGGCGPDQNIPVEVTPGEATVDTSEAIADFTVEKKATGNNEGKLYELNELVEYTITVKNTGNVTLTNVDAVDTLTWDRASFENIAPGESQSFTTVYRVTEKDIDRGEVVNKVNASAKVDDRVVKSVEANETIKTVGKNPHLLLSKKATSKPANGAAYALGETITYVIGVVNDGNQTLTNVSVEDPLTGGKWFISEIKPGEANAEEITTSYTVTADDIKEGKVVNEVTANGGGLDPEKDVTPGIEEVPTVKAAPGLWLEKKAEGNAADRYYKLNETVNYAITVANTGNVTLNNVTVYDQKTDLNEVIASLQPYEKKTYYTSYTVTAEDIRIGEVVNKANALDEGTVSVEATEIIKTEAVNSHLTLTKATVSTPANGIAYTLGEEIKYEISIVNDGNVTLHDVVIADPLTNGQWTITEIVPGQSSTVMETSYKVGEDDISRGKVVNEAIVRSVSEDDPKPEVTGGRTEDDTDKESRLLIISKEATSTPANGNTYALGETITYEIRAENKGNQTLTDVVVVDNLTGKTWTIAEIKPNQRSAAMTTSYVVQEADILKGEVLNVATAREQNPPTDKPVLIVEEGQETVPTVADDPSLFAKKDAQDINKKYALGEEVEYTISVLNNGNVTIHDVEIFDELTGARWTIDSLSTDGKPETFTTKYTVTEADIRAGKIVNVVTVKGLDPEGNPVDTTATETVNTVPLQESVSVLKTVTNTKDQYEVGDTINYQIAVKNTGTVPLHNVRVADQLTGTNGRVSFTDLAGGIAQENGEVVFSELGVGEERFITCEYTVVRSDANSSIGNTVEVTSDEITTPEPGATPNTPIEKLYRLTIHYVYATGGTAAEDYIGEYLAGEGFGIQSPVIAGYNPDMAFVRSGEDGMPESDEGVEITVTYSAALNPAPGPTDPTPTPGPTDPTPTPGPTDPTPTPGPTDPTPTPGSTDPTPTPGPTDPTPTPGPTDPVLIAVAPTAPVVPGAAAPVVLTAPTAGLAAIPDGEVAGAAIELDDEGDPILTAVSDERVPLTNRELDEHVCCIMSFLLMFATMIIYTWFTHSMKKRQKKLVGLRDQLAEETLRRQLGIMDDQQSIM